jgi:hypothetical protein
MTRNGESVIYLMTSMTTLPLEPKGTASEQTLATQNPVSKCSTVRGLHPRIRGEIPIEIWDEAGGNECGLGTQEETPARPSGCLRRN